MFVRQTCLLMFYALTLLAKKLVSAESECQGHGLQLQSGVRTGCVYDALDGSRCRDLAETRLVHDNLRRN